jgi:hypothetical protein
LVPWTWEEIDEAWLGGATGHADPGPVFVDAFDRVERFFGREWLLEMHGGGSGLHNAVLVATLGKQLRILETASGCLSLVRQLRLRNPDARAELHAISIALPRPTGSIALECEPVIAVAGRSRRPDFRLAQDGTDDPEWTYVEVTRPNEAHAEQALRQAMDVLDTVLDKVAGRYAVAVVFHSQPSREEAAAAKDAAWALCAGHKSANVELPGLATIVFAEDASVSSLPTDGITPAPSRLGSTRTRIEGDVVRQMSVHVPYADERSVGFLESEAPQLPETHPGLVMISVGSAPGALREWPDILQRQLALGLYDNVSAVCLFDQGFSLVEAGYSWTAETVLIPNPRATQPLPAWLVEQLESWRPRRA